MIHMRALIEIACKILGLMFLIWGINASAFIPVGWLMRPDDEATEQQMTISDLTEVQLMRPDDEATEQVIQDEDEGERVKRTIAIYKRLTMPILYFLFAFVFLKYADTIAHLLGRKDWHISIFSHGDWSQVLYNMGILLIGVFMVVKGVPRVIHSGTSFFAFSQVSLIPTHIWGQVIASLAYLALGFYLLAGSSPVAKLKNVVNPNDD